MYIRIGLTFTITILFVFYGLDILKNGIIRLIDKSPNMDSLVSVSVLVSFFYSYVSMMLMLFNKGEGNLYFESSAMIIYFVKLGRFIEHKSREKTKESIKELVKITPDHATKMTNIGEKVVTIDEIKKGDILKCLPGEKIAVDGIITLGKAHFEEGFITGESVSPKKKEGDEVLAGAINVDGYIEYKADRIGANSTISEIVKLVNEAVNTKAPIQRLADFLSGRFVPSIFLIALLTLVIYLLIGKSFNDALLTFVTILVVACPCALGLATPLAVVVSEGVSAKKGILIKKSEILENASKCDTIVFDKTGTLTKGELKITKLFNFSDDSDEEVLSLVASVESRSSHPISKTFNDYLKEEKEVKNFKHMSGIGVYGEIGKKSIYIGNNKIFRKLDIENKYDEMEKYLSNSGCTIMYVIINDKVTMQLGIKDAPRTGVKSLIKKLYKMNKEVILLSGDNEGAARALANDIGIKNVIASVMPKEKKKIIDDLIKDGHRVMMVGDGINDAPALQAATVSVSVDNATDIASNSSDVILTTNELSKVIELLEISSNTLRIIKENLVWAFIYNIIMIMVATGVLKPFGIYVSPELAAIFMVISSVSVTLNSLRLKRQ